MTYLKKFVGTLNPLIQNCVQQDYLPEIYPLYPASYLKCHLSFNIACYFYLVWKFPPPSTKPWLETLHIISTNFFLLADNLPVYR